MPEKRLPGRRRNRRALVRSRTPPSSFSLLFFHFPHLVREKIQKHASSSSSYYSHFFSAKASSSFRGGEEVMDSITDNRNTGDNGACPDDLQQEPKGHKEVGEDSFRDNGHRSTVTSYSSGTGKDAVRGQQISNGMTSPSLFHVYLPSSARKALSSYVYKGEDRSYLYKYIWRPLCRKSVSIVPSFISANAITVLALIQGMMPFALHLWFSSFFVYSDFWNTHICSSSTSAWNVVPCRWEAGSSNRTTHYDSTPPNRDYHRMTNWDRTLCHESGEKAYGGVGGGMEREAHGMGPLFASSFTAMHTPSFVFVLNAVALLLYQYLDNLDGHQARHLNMSSPLGLWLDHGCDAFHSVVMAFCVSSYLSLGASWKTLLVLCSALSTFFMNTWEEYHLGELILPVVNGPNEGLWILCTMYLWTALKGSAWWLEECQLLYYDPLASSPTAAPYYYVSSVLCPILNKWGLCTVGGEAWAKTPTTTRTGTLPLSLTCRRHTLFVWLLVVSAFFTCLGNWYNVMIRPLRQRNRWRRIWKRYHDEGRRQMKRIMDPRPFMQYMSQRSVDSTRTRSRSSSSMWYRSDSPSMSSRSFVRGSIGSISSFLSMGEESDSEPQKEEKEKNPKAVLAEKKKDNGTWELAAELDTEEQRTKPREQGGKDFFSFAGQKDKRSWGNGYSNAKGRQKELGLIRRKRDIGRGKEDEEGDDEAMTFSPHITKDASSSSASEEWSSSYPSTPDFSIAQSEGMNSRQKTKHHSARERENGHTWIEEPDSNERKRKTEHHRQRKAREGDTSCNRAGGATTLSSMLLASTSRAASPTWFSGHVPCPLFRFSSLVTKQEECGQGANSGEAAPKKNGRDPTPEEDEAARSVETKAERGARYGVWKGEESVLYDDNSIQERAPPYSEEGKESRQAQWKKKERQAVASLLPSPCSLSPNLHDDQEEKVDQVDPQHPHIRMIVVKEAEVINPWDAWRTLIPVMYLTGATFLTAYSTDAFVAHPYLFSASVGLLYTYITISLMLAHMCAITLSQCPSTTWWYVLVCTFLVLLMSSSLFSWGTLSRLSSAMSSSLNSPASSFLSVSSTFSPPSHVSKPFTDGERPAANYTPLRWNKDGSLLSNETLSSVFHRPDKLSSRPHVPTWVMGSVFSMVLLSLIHFSITSAVEMAKALQIHSIFHVPHHKRSAMKRRNKRRHYVERLKLYQSSAVLEKSAEVGGTTGRKSRK